MFFSICLSNKNAEAVLRNLKTRYVFKNKKIYWMLDVSWTGSYEITLLICPSVHPSLSFLTIGSLVFSNIHDDADHDI